MSDPVQIALIAAGVSLFPAVLTFLNGLRQRENHLESMAKIEVVRQDVNGKMEKMQEVIAVAAKAEGKLEGKAEEKANPS